MSALCFFGALCLGSGGPFRALCLGSGGPGNSDSRKRMTASGAGWVHTPTQLLIIVYDPTVQTFYVHHKDIQTLLALTLLHKLPYIIII